MTPDEEEELERRRHAVGTFNFGSQVLPGVSKLNEECGEIVQVIGKLMSTNGLPLHWAAGNLRLALLEEMADAYAAITFVLENSGFSTVLFEQRVQEKLAKFNEWHDRVDLPPEQPQPQPQLRGGLEC